MGAVSAIETNLSGEITQARQQLTASSSSSDVIGTGLQRQLEQVMSKVAECGASVSGLRDGLKESDAKYTVANQELKASLDRVKVAVMVQSLSTDV